MARILVVDDDPDFQSMLAMVLESAGYDVDMAFDGKQALARMRELRPDLVILDVMMTTDTEGFGVARSIRAEPSLAAIPIIMLTSIHEEKKLTYRLEPDPTWLPVDRFLDKPVKPALLLASVTEALAGARLGRDKGDAQ